MLNKMKPGGVVKILLFLLLFVPSLLAQEYKVIHIKGDVKFRSNTSETWTELKEGQVLNLDEFISTGVKASVQIENLGNIIIIEELSAVSIASIKKMSTDELLLALAMEDMINVPKSEGKGKGNSGSTAVYGEKEGTENKTEINLDDFGIKRLNGAIQLAKNDLLGSSVIFAKETYRKHPNTKQIASYRIFFADVLYEKGLYEEALGEYLEIQKLELNKEQFAGVEKQISSINKILLNN
jgi:hypothetical protein